MSKVPPSPRKHAVQLKHLIVAVLAACAGLATAQSYPSKPITFVVPAAAGGAADVLARALAQQMGQQMGQQIIVDNRPGAGGVMGAQLVAHAAADGYTLLVTPSAPLLTSPFLFSNVKYNARRDFAFITPLCTGSLVLAVNPQRVPAHSMKEFVTWAQGQRGQLSYGSYGVGSAAHLLGAYLDQSRRLDMTHIAYKGEAPLLQDLAGGQVPTGIATSGSMAPHLQSGRLRALAVLGDRRLPELPEVPTMKEAGFSDPEFTPIGWAALVAPAATPPAILQRLEQEARAAVQTATMQARFQIFGMRALGTSSAEFRREFDAQSLIVERLVKLSAAKMD